MKKFKIRALATSVCYLEVEAADEEDAYRQGKDADGGIFTEEEAEGSWEITDVEDLTPPDPLSGIIAKMWEIEQHVAEALMDVQTKEEDAHNYSIGFGEICVPEDASPELDNARTHIQDAIAELAAWEKQTGSD